jgi:methylmalonyl-CoA mutase
MKENLFEEFSYITKEDWIRQAVRDLKGRDFENTLVTGTPDGIKIAPFYTAEDACRNGTQANANRSIAPNPPIPGFSPRYWSNVFEVRDQKTTNKEILLALEKGADALMIYLEGDENLEALLQEVLPQYIQIFIVPGKDPVASLLLFLEWIKRSGYNPSEIQGGLLWDGFANTLCKRISKEKVIELAASILDIAKEMDQFRVFAIDASVYHNAGASTVQELGYSLSAYIELLDDLTQRGVSANQIFEKTMLKTAVGSDYFMEMAKIKTSRFLFHQLAKLYQVTIPMENIFIFSSTSFWTKSKIDVQTNMLRNTTEAMASILGGCNALQVLTHDVVFGTNDSFSIRMARNISNILKEECYLDKVLDPMAGSYYLENLNNDLFAAVHSKLIEIENSGGWWKLYQSNEIQKAVKVFREQKMVAIQNGTRTKIGVNKFTNPKEVFDKDDKVVGANEDWQLKPARECELMEENQNPKP